MNNFSWRNCPPTTTIPCQGRRTRCHGNQRIRSPRGSCTPATRGSSGSHPRSLLKIILIYFFIKINFYYTKANSEFQISTIWVFSFGFSFSKARTEHTLQNCKDVSKFEFAVKHTVDYFNTFLFLFVICNSSKYLTWYFSCVTDALFESMYIVYDICFKNLETFAIVLKVPRHFFVGISFSKILFFEISVSNYLNIL